MKIAVMGAGGMLGREVVRAIAERDGLTPIPFTHEQCEIHVLSDVRMRLGSTLPDVVINCAGARPDKPNVAMACANAAGPLVLAEGCRRVGARFVHVSTDCVFSGRGRNAGLYEPDSSMSPTDYYGLTKAAGEWLPEKSLVVRTSFIGLDHGVVRDLLAAAKSGAETFPGYVNAFWSGSTVGIVADKLVDLATDPEGFTGKLHLATRHAISKAALLRLIVEVFKLKIRIVDAPEPVLNRALVPSVVMAPASDGLAALEEQWRLRGL